MRAIKQGFRFRVTRKQQGVAAVEFAIIASVFFLIFCGIVEWARAMYICNTLQEVTRRGAALAANADFSMPTVMQRVREQAVFRDSPGFLAFAEPVSDASIHIDYMWIKRDESGMTMQAIPSGSLPSSPAANYTNCINDPYSEKCIRLVRVSVCASITDGKCMPVDYKTMVSPMPFRFGLPVATTIVNAETLGMPAGTPVEPCGCP